MGFPPDVFLIGAQRAGTTTLATMLAQHPKITVSNPKEPAYFTIREHLGPQWYRSTFSGPTDNLFLDATTWHSVGPTDRFCAPDTPGDQPYDGVPARIFSVNQHAKFIYVLREPSARTYSAYWFYKRERVSPDNFREAIDADEFYLRGSDYYGQMNNYLEYFPLSSFLLLRFEDMINDMGHALERCYDFLEIEAIQFRAHDNSYTKNAAIGSSALGEFLEKNFLTRMSIQQLVNAASRIRFGAIASTLKYLLTKDIPRMQENDREYIAKLLADRNRMLEELTGVDLSIWAEIANRPS